MNDGYDKFQKKLNSALQAFKAIIGYIPELACSNAYFPYADGAEKLKYPYADSPGCYVFYSKHKSVKYIGKASRHLGNRIWSHIGRSSIPNESEKYPNADAWLIECQPNVAVFCIPVPDDQWWIALALEGFLTERFLPEKRRV